MFEEFTPISKKKWQEKVIKDLKGSAFDELQWHLGQDLLIDPFYHADDSIPANIVNGRKSANWQIGENFFVQDFSNSNKSLLKALNQGVNAPCLIFDSVPTVEQLSDLLKGIVPSYIKLNFKLEGGENTYSSLLENYRNYLGTQQTEGSTLEGGLFFEAPSREAANMILKKVQNHLPKYRCLTVSNSNTSFDDPTTYLSELLTKVDLHFQWVEPDALSHIKISIEIGKSYFVEIAKIRAIRLLWDHLCKAYQIPAAPLFIDASFREDAYDQDTNTNMIRSMSMAMSAVIGGVNRLTIRPADQVASTMTDRIARNVQHLLKMESYMDRVIDPAAGSYYIEKLTNLFVEKAWYKFTKA